MLQSATAGWPWSWLTVAVLAAEPVRRRIQTRLERRFLGERGDPLGVLARLHAALSDGNEDENTVYATVSRTVAAAVRSPAVALAVQRGPQIETVSITGTEQDAALVLPLVYRGERIGEMRVSTRTPGEPYGRVDRALLDQLANETSALVYALRRDTELQAMRRRALETVAEERARLGRDLHDGIAPLLAGAGLTAEALRKGMAPDTADERDAERLAARLRNAATEIRRLAHDLQPTPVDNRGLEAALSDYVATLDAPEMPTIQFRADIARSLPTAVEQGAYLVVLEALNNVVGHAHAKHCEVSVALASGELVLQSGRRWRRAAPTVRKRDWHHLHASPGPGPRRRLRPRRSAGWRDLASGADPGRTVTPIRLVVVDDHMVFREGLRALLGRVDDIEIVGEAANTQDAIEVTEAVRPDVVLMDLNLPGDGGEVATTTIIAAHPEVAVLVLTMHSDDAHLRHALHAGARGYLLKDAEPDAIIRAIVAVHEGQAIFDRGIAPRVIAATRTPEVDRPFPILTDREYEILDRLARGCETTRSQPGWASA